MAQYKVLDPQGKERIIEGPDNATDEEIISQAQVLFGPSNGRADIEAHKARGRQLQEDIDRIKYDPTAGMSFPAKVVTSFDQGVSKAGRGMKQALAAITGDDKWLSELNAEEDDLAASDQQLLDSAGTAGHVASFTGQYVAPALATGAVGKVVQTPAWLAQSGLTATAGRVALGAGGGAANGYMTPLGTEEEVAGDRTSNTLSGAVIGGAIPAGLSGFNALREIWRKGHRSLPKEEVQALAVKLGYSPDDAVMGKSLEDLRKVVEDKFQQLSKSSNEAYSAIELNPELPPVNLSPEFSKMMEGALDNPASLYQLAGDKRVRDAYAAMSGVRGASLTFRQVRDLQRALKEQAASIGGKNPLWDMSNALDGELDDWTRQGSVDMMDSGLKGLPDSPGRMSVPGTEPPPGYSGDVGLEDLFTKPSKMKEEALAAAREQDAWYRDNIGPMVNKKESALAQFRGGYDGSYPAGKEGVYLPTGTRSSGSTALNIKDLLERVPEARDPMRRLMAEQLMIPDATTATAKRLHTLPIGQVSGQADGIRAQQLAEAMMNEESVPAFLRAKFPGAGESLHRYFNGIDPAGFVPGKGGKLTPEMITAQILSGAGL